MRTRLYAVATRYVRQLRQLQPDEPHSSKATDGLHPSVSRGRRDIRCARFVVPPVAERIAFDIESYERRAREGPCFICALASGDVEYRRTNVMIHEDSDVLVFLNRYPTLRGYALQDHMGGLERTQDFARLFMIPTMYHCSGGYGPTHFDLINPIVHWVEQRQAPRSITVTGSDPQDASATRSRPVFAYPERAVYTGTGSVDDAANFTGVMPSQASDDHVDWLGQDLYNVPPHGVLVGQPAFAAE